MTMPLNIAHDALYMIEYRDSPAVLVLADGEAAAERGRRAAEQAGCRVSDTVGIEEAVDRLDRQAAVSTVVVELDRDHGAVLDRLLDRLEAAARADRHGRDRKSTRLNSSH